MTTILIEKHSPMWTNKQIWEFEQANQNLKFDVLLTEQNAKKNWGSKHAHLECNVREAIQDNLDYLAKGYELWISNSEKKPDEKHIPYLMALAADIMIEEEITLKFRTEDGCLGVSVDFDADIIDCKEFFEEFYHLATGVNYDSDTGIPQDETEAEIYLTRLQEEFDEKMKENLGDKYMPGNNDPDSITPND
jgi:hypothetical protein